MIDAENRLRAAHDAGEWWSEIIKRAFDLKASEAFLAWSDCLALLDELERLRAALDSDKAGMYAAGLTLEAEVVRLRAALKDISVVSGANYPGVLARAALLLEEGE